MGNADRIRAMELYRAAKSAAQKAERNRRKLTFMSLTARDRFAFDTYGDQLDAMVADAATASKSFAAFVADLSTSEVVSIIAEASA